MPFIRPPPLSLPTPLSYTSLKDPSHIQVIDEEVAALLEKGAIEEVSPSPGFYSRVFVVPKKDGGWRPVINLKLLNKQYLDPPSFRMDTAKDVGLLLQESDWAASIDLRDAYFHVSVSRRFHRFMRFGWRKRLYQFLVLPFGLCTAPFVFTMLTKPIVAYLRSKGIRTIFYLDDILVIGSSREECQKHLDFALQLLQDLGFIINWKKSTLIPSQHFRFLGLLWNTTAGTIGLPEEKRLSLIRRASKTLLSPPSCRDLQVLLGHLTSSIPAVPLIRLRSRQLQRDLHDVYQSEADSRLPVHLSQDSARDLSWIASLDPLQCIAPMWPLQLEQCDLEVATDASDIGWGIHFDGRLHRGRWDVDAPRHINARELLTLRIFLTDFLPSSVSHQSLLWRTDSSTAIAYVRKEGGTASPLLLDLATEILLLAHRRHIRIFPVFLPSAENLLADAASRFQDLPDWHLHPDLFQRLVRLWGLPEIDLFATQQSTQLDRFFAWGQAQGAEAFDALAQHWEFSLAYAFPPPPILPRTISKIARSPGEFILITPFWRAQKWFPLLLALNIVEIRRFPQSQRLVVDLSTGLPPLNLHHLHLVVWRIIGGSELSISQIPRSASSLMDGGNRHPSGTTPSGNVSGTFYIPEEFLSIPLI